MKKILILIFIFSISSLHSQVLISNSNGVPDSTAMLDVESTEKGFLPPRMTSIQRDGIVSPSPGLIIYCTDCLEMQMFNDTAWTSMLGLPPSIPPPTPTITLGSQTWMAANLDVGTMINGSTTMTNNSILEKYCMGDNPLNCSLFGGLYQWDEMMQYVTTPGTQGVCPTGFHLPTDDEWKTLEMHLGMTQTEADDTGFRGTDEGSQLAGNESIWTDGNLESNGAFGSSGFAAHSGGYYQPAVSKFLRQLIYAHFWSSSEFEGEAWSRQLAHQISRVLRIDESKSYAYSVRCVQD